MDVFLLQREGHVPSLTQSAQCCLDAHTEDTQGTAYALSSKTPTLTSWLSQTQRAARAQHTQTFDSGLFCVDSRPEGVHCRAVHSSCDLQASFDKAATCAGRTGGLPAS